MMISESKITILFDEEKIEKADIEELVAEKFAEIEAILKNRDGIADSKISIEYDDFE